MRQLIIYVSISTCIYIGSVILSYFLMKENDKKTKIKEYDTDGEFFQTSIAFLMNLFLSVVYTSVKFTEVFSWKNSTYEDFVDFTGLKASPVSLFTNDIKIAYNINDTDRCEYEDKMSKNIGKDVYIKYNNQTRMEKRIEYFPITFISPGLSAFNNSKIGINLEDEHHCPNEEFICYRSFKNSNNANIISLIKETKSHNFIIMNINFDELMYYTFVNTDLSRPKISILYNKNILFNYDVYIREEYRIEKTINVESGILDMIFIFDIYSNGFTDRFFIVLAVVSIIYIIIIFLIYRQYTTSKYLSNKYGFANQILSYVNHEIRNPLNTIQGLLDITIHDINNIPSCKNDSEKEIILSNLGAALRSCGILNHIVNDILDIQRMKENKMQINNAIFSVSDLMYDLEKFFINRMSEKPKVKMEIVNAIDSMYSDRVRIEQILINLISNSFKFTEEGYIYIRNYIKNEKYIMEVEDTGRGIPEKSYSKIFCPFEQNELNDSLRHGGIGLGLNLCKILINTMGGEIYFESKEKIGSKFWIELPIKQ